MSAGTFEVHEGRQSKGARSDRDRMAATQAEPHLTYDLTVLAADVPSVVSFAAGWLCDRVRAGWRVTVVVPVGQDVRPLQIMGVDVVTAEPEVDALRGRSAAAWAVDAAVLDADPDIRYEVKRALDRAQTEITVWGAAESWAKNRRFTAVRHRLSAAARAFKQHALLTSGQDAQVPAVENFLSAALWYAPDGADLVPISAGE
ncbi:hypothetical protein [Mycobacterium sp. SMC-4]|uniref:hypothetical protein n=1 Tax=Mycobacterium sp. SMC-4 TaxID=2857059 RepID=UPI0021B40E3F|nr:hypothetical protein [Mycobacterium sp. SMC-4]UXA19864.1 hypothetical protein KXD98_09870 [Mycobacterium sp. SMC-4]